MPLEWRDALLVPVPKKRDLCCCDNWKGISLLDVMGKLFMHVSCESTGKIELGRNKAKLICFTKSIILS